MILHGDCLEELKTLDEDSVDFVCTDPPYGIGFMGKAWDTFKPEQVKKMQDQNKKRPPRTDGRSVPIGGPARDAGSYDYRRNREFQSFITEIGEECLRVLKPGAFMVMTMAPRQDVLSRAMIGLEDAGFNIGFTSMYWTFASGFPKASNIGKLVDKRLGVEREVKGTYDPRSSIDGSNRNEQEIGGQQVTRSSSQVEITEATSQEAKALDGSYAGFQPKPAVEVIIVAMKPLSEKTFADQALKNRKGISWLDDGRIPKSSDRPRINNRPKTEAFGVYQPDVTGGHSDSGSYSRYFDLDKWASTLPFLIVPKASKSEKNKGLDNFDAVLRSDGQSVTTIGANNPRNRTGTPKQNHHPTVKPLKLMSYLITLFTREGDTVLDPFVGSGTTCVAAQNLSRKFIGIEREAEYVEIAKARLDAEKQEVLL